MKLSAAAKAEVKAIFSRMGQKGGRVRADKMTKDERIAAATHAAKTRWAARREKAAS